MRRSLHELIQKTILFKYYLPEDTIGISKTLHTTDKDSCYTIDNKNNLIEIIYNSIIEYSFNEFDITNKDLDALHTIALQTKLKYNLDADLETKVKYGFFGEVILYSVLVSFFNATPLIARGIFYNPLEKSETKGYDSYHLIENNGNIELWFGEAKFHADYKSGLNSVFGNIEKALSDDYLKANILAFYNHKNNFNIQGSQLDYILNTWEDNPTINLIDEINRYSMKLVYPILILFEEGKVDFDTTIKEVIEFIKDKHPELMCSLSIEYSLFFIFIPVKEVNDIKKTVIGWIESRVPLMS